MDQENDGPLHQPVGATNDPPAAASTAPLLQEMAEPAPGQFAPQNLIVRPPVPLPLPLVPRMFGATPVATVAPQPAPEPAPETEPVGSHGVAQGIPAATGGEPPVFSPVPPAPPFAQAGPAPPVIEDEPVLQAEPVLQDEPVLQAEPALQAEPVLQDEPVLQVEPALQAEPVLHDEPALQAEPVLQKENGALQEPQISFTAPPDDPAPASANPATDASLVTGDDPGIGDGPARPTDTPLSPMPVWPVGSPPVVPARGVEPPPAIEPASEPPVSRPVAHSIVTPAKTPDRTVETATVAILPLAWRLWRASVVAAKIAVLSLGVWYLIMLGLIALYRTVDPPGSALMTLRWLGGQSIDQTFVPLHVISPALRRAVLVSEDGQFCRHRGFDFGEIRSAINRGESFGRGASTITQQLAKNLFLWPERSYIRKALEVPLTITIEQLWPKSRIFEVYLNVAEWGPGVFGAEAAARSYFGKPASRLSEREAALLAVALPNPLARDASDPEALQLRLATRLQERMRSQMTFPCIVPDAVRKAL